MHQVFARLQETGRIFKFTSKTQQGQHSKYFCDGMDLAIHIYNSRSETD